jgi:hypothetical protein
MFLPFRATFRSSTVKGTSYTIAKDRNKLYSHTNKICKNCRFEILTHFIIMTVQLTVRRFLATVKQVPFTVEPLKVTLKGKNM